MADRLNAELYVLNVERENIDSHFSWEKAND